jgi:hypothetical protein
MEPKCIWDDSGAFLASHSDPAAASFHTTSHAIIVAGEGLRLRQRTRAGLGGRPGSIWVVNTMGLMTATEGHKTPDGPFFELLDNLKNVFYNFANGVHGEGSGGVSI